MRTHIYQWENGFGVHIPQEIIDALGLTPGSLVDVKLEDNYICVYPKRYALSPMVREINIENLHELYLDDFFSQGKEEW